LAELDKALALAGDPTPPSIRVFAGYCHYFGREYDQAIDDFNGILAQNPSWNWVHNMTAKCYIQQERYGEALEELDKAERMFGGADPFWNAHVHMDRGKIYAAQGETQKAETELEFLMNSTGRQNRRIATAGVLFALGRTDEALDWLEAAATAREPHIVTLRKAPDLESVKPNPRFQALLKRIGLADA